VTIHVCPHHVVDTHFGDVRGGCRDNKVKYVTALVSRLSDVLHASERLHQLSQTDGVWVISYIDVNVEVTTQLLQDSCTSSIARTQWTVHRKKCLLAVLAWPIDAK